MQGELQIGWNRFGVMDLVLMAPEDAGRYLMMACYGAIGSIAVVRQMLDEYPVLVRCMVQYTRKNPVLPRTYTYAHLIELGFRMRRRKGGRWYAIGGTMEERLKVNIGGKEFDVGLLDLIVADPLRVGMILANGWLEEHTRPLVRKWLKEHDFLVRALITDTKTCPYCERSTFARMVADTGLASAPDTGNEDDDSYHITGRLP